MKPLLSVMLVLFARAITAVQAIWQDSSALDRQCIYFANHSSHGDFVLVWAVLPPQLRQRTRPVAGADYWLKNRVNRFIGCDLFNAILIERDQSIHDIRNHNPVDVIASALDDGSSLIIFPEGTRNQSEDPLLQFKGGLYRLAKARPEIDLVPVWINNLNRVMPKGKFIPVPLICSVTFGKPLRVEPDENRQKFTARAEAALLALSPHARAKS